MISKICKFIYSTQQLNINGQLAQDTIVHTYINHFCHSKNSLKKNIITKSIYTFNDFSIPSLYNCNSYICNGYI